MINKEAQAFIDRLAALNYDEPHFNLNEVTKALRRQYKILGVEMPEIEVADNMVAGYELARGAAWDAAWGAARDAARGAAQGGAARDAARDAAWDAAWDAAQGAAQGAAALNTNLKDPATTQLVEITAEGLKALENGLGYYFPMKDKLILVPVPRMVISNERLHYDHGKAVEWTDGTGFYFLRGVQFDEKLYWKIVDQKATTKEILEISNSDQRMAAISMMKPGELLKQINARLVHTGKRGTKLYECENFMDSGETEYAIWMKDSSTPREFLEFVPPEVGKQRDADFCQASAWGVPLEDYLNLKEEA